MTENRPTEQLHKLLEECGVEYEAYRDIKNRRITKWRTYHGAFVFFAVEKEGKLFVETASDTEHSAICTPEQAIAATLGSERLTAEQVRETVEKHGVNDGCVYSIFKGFFKAIADELNAKLGSGTCENLSSMNVDGVAGYHFICSECGLSVCASMGIGEIEPSGSRSFRWKVDGRYEFERCPRCGKEVKR